MKRLPVWTRREFLADVTIGASLVALAEPLAAGVQTTGAKRWPIVVFSKAFQDLSFEDSAELVAEVGWEGIECPVRKGGQVLPERVQDDLPRLVTALRRHGRELQLMATDIRSVNDDHVETVLRTASKLGIRLYRLGPRFYDRDRSIPAQLKEVRAELADLAALNKELGLCAGFQNHSGSNNIGAPVWDLFELISDLAPEHLGVFFDIGHATVEGGYAWRTHAQLTEPFVRSVYVKDFRWQQTARGWRAQWCPLGEGMIPRAFFERLRRSQFTGPISQHFEYDLGERPRMITAFKQDLATLRAWLQIDA